MPRRPLTALGLTACLVLALCACLGLALGGCGSSSSSSTSTGSTTPAATSPSTAEATSPQGEGSGQGSEAGSTNSTAPSTSSGSTTESGGDNSIQTYGSEAAGAEKAELSTAALSFFKALAGPDYAKICAGIASSNRQELQAFLKAKHQQGGCPTILKTLIPPSAAPEARKAANATVTGVRIKGDTAFVLFRPAGGPPSYFVMKRENGEWKAISLAPGTPLNPAAAVGG